MLFHKLLILFQESKSPIASQEMDKSSRTTSPEEKDKFKTEEELEDIRNRSEEGEDLSMPNTGDSGVKQPIRSPTPTQASEVTNMKNRDGYPLMSAVSVPHLKRLLYVIVNPILP